MLFRFLFFTCLCVCPLNAFAGSDSAAVRKQILLFDSLAWEQMNEKIDSAIILGKQAYALSAKEKDSMLLFQTARTLGSAFVRKGYYQQGIAYYTTAQQIGEKKKVGDDLAKVYTGLAVIYKRLENYPQAVVYNRKALAIDEQAKDSAGIAADYNNLGVVLRYLKQYKESIGYLEKAIAIRSVIEPKKLPTTYSNLGNSLCSSGDHEAAIVIYEKARAGRKLKANDDLLLANLGNCFSHIGNNARALELLDSALVLAKENSSLYSLKVVHGLTAEVHEARGDYGKALFHLKQYNLFSDSLQMQETTEKLAEIEEQYESARKDRDIAQLSRLNLGLQLEGERKQRMLWILGLCAVAVLFFVLFLFQRKQRIEKAKQDKKLLAEKEKGISAMLSAVETERERIARDLHDGIAQQLAAMKLALQQVTRGKTLPAETDAQLQEQIERLDLSGKEIRSIAHDIMPPALRRFGLAAAISDLTAKTGMESGMEVLFDDFTDGAALPETVSVHLYRVSQEIIGNAVRHSGATRLQVQLLLRDNRLVLRMEDNGKGFTFDAVTGGAGLLNIQNRITLLNGELHVDTAPGAGVSYLIRVPL